MAMNFTLPAENRDDQGKGASRRLRRTGRIPAIMYGAHQEPTAVSVSENTLMQHLQHEAFYSSIVKVELEGEVVRAVLKDLQRHPAKPTVLHLDLLRISDDEKLRIHVPLHFINEEGNATVKTGGVVSHHLIEVEVSCFAKDLPEFIEVDMAEIEAGAPVHLSDLRVPEGVELVELAHGSDHDQAVVSIHVKRGGDEAEEEAAEGEE